MWKIILLLTLSLPVAARAELLPDTTFGNGGTVDVALPELPFWNKPYTTVLPDRRVVTAIVRGKPGPFFSKIPVLSITRLQPDGSIDPTFGNGAPAVLELSPLAYDFSSINEIVVRPDGSLFALITHASQAGGRRMILVSVTADGRLDPAFNGGAPLAVANQLYQRPKVFDTGNGYLVVGANRAECCVLQYGFDAWRVRADGTPDPTFGTGGSLVVPDNEEATGTTDVMPLAGGGFQTLNVRTDQPQTYYWRRYRADGSVDTTFGNGGDQAIPAIDDAGYLQVYPLGDGTHAVVGGTSCVQGVFDAQGQTLSAFDGLCIGGTTTNPFVQAYGGKLLVSAEMRFGGTPPPTDGTYLWVLDRNGAVDRAFAEPQGDRWRPTTNPNASYAVAADADRGVVLAVSGESTLRVQRYVDVRRGVAPNQPIPALGVPAVLLLLGGAAALARRRLAGQ